MPQPTRNFAQTQPVPLTAIGAAFLTVSLCGIGGGGGLVWARRIAVERRRWISDQDFADIIGLCQFMPGPNVVGIAVCVGAKLRGGAGSLAALAGFLIIPWTIGLVLGLLLIGYAHHPVVRGTLAGLSAAGAGLMIATGIRILKPHLGRPAALVFAALAIVLIVLVKLSPLVVLFGLVPLSVAVAGVQSRAGR